MNTNTATTDEFQVMEDLRSKTSEFWSTTGWTRIWIGIILRRHYAVHPDSFTHWRKLNNWVKVLEWQMRPGQWKPEALNLGMRGFLTVGDNIIGSKNPWSIAKQIVLKGYWIDEYSIGKVCSFCGGSLA